MGLTKATVMQKAIEYDAARRGTVFFDASGTISGKRLVELYALTNQVGFIGRRELDAAPVLAEAFVRVKMAG